MSKCSELLEAIWGSKFSSKNNLPYVLLNNFVNRPTPGYSDYDKKLLHEIGMWAKDKGVGSIRDLVLLDFRYCKEEPMESNILDVMNKYSDEEDEISFRNHNGIKFVVVPYYNMVIANEKDKDALLDQ